MTRVCRRTRATLSYLVLAVIIFTILNLFIEFSDLSSWYDYYKSVTNEPKSRAIYDNLTSADDTRVRVAHGRTQPPVNLQDFTDLLKDLGYHEDNHNGDSNHENIKISDENVHENIQNSPQVPSKSWLLDNPNILVYEAVSDDLMPDYFDLSADLVPQFERYFEETKSIMEKRRQQIQQQCIRKKTYLTTAQNFLLYFAGLNMAWCPAFKAGSTNWKQFFCKIYKPDVYYKYLEKVDEPPYCPLGVLMDHKNSKKHDELQQKRWTEGVKGAVKFLTVRHPYERLISVYTNKFKNCDSPMFTDNSMIQILQNYRDFRLPLTEKAELIEAARLECHKPSRDRVIDKDNPYMNPMGATFREFVQYVVGNFHNRVPPDFHWVQITKGCDLCIKDYDIIEKFETLERDHYFVLKTVGEESRYPDIAGAHTNPSGNAPMNKDKIMNYFSTLNEQLIWELQSIYRDDISLFGYNPLFRVKKNPYNM